MQLRIPDGTRYDPLPAGPRHYVPVLQNQKGERDALRALPAAAWDRLTPVLCVVGDKQPKQALTDSRVRGWAAALAAATTGHAFYVDAVRQDPDAPVTDRTGSTPLLRRLHERLRAHDCLFVPVYRERWHSPTAASAVTDAHDQDGRGAGLRLALDGGVTTQVPAADRATQALAGLGLPAEDVDLLVDLGHVSPDADPDEDGLLDTLSRVAQVSWRHVVLLATTMPSALGKDLVPAGTTGQLPRHERQVWQAARLALPALDVVYGDYAVQHPEPPVDKSGPGMRANIRYTTDRTTLVARGVSPVLTVGNGEYPGLCTDLTRHPDFAGPAFSWGDTVIDGCAHGHVAPGGLSMWRGAGTSHHLAHVLDELKCGGRARPAGT